MRLAWTSYAAAVLTVVLLSGCAQQMLSDERIASTTAMALGQPPGSVTIADRQYDGATNTFYTARTRNGAFRCTINGGGLLAAGMTNPPQCSRI